MEPIVVNSQLDKKKLYNINMYLLYRKRMMWYLGVIVIIMLYGLLFFNSSTAGDSSRWFGIFFVVFYLLMPLLVYWGVNKSYNKVKALSEYKVYRIDENEINVVGQTVSLTVDWSHIEKLQDRKHDFLMVTLNGMGFHYLPKSGFESEQAIIDLKNIVKQKGIKNKS